MLAVAVMRCAMKLSSAWLSNVSGQILTCKEVDMIATIDGKSAAWMAGYASVERRRAVAIAPLMLASQHDYAWSQCGVLLRVSIGDRIRHSENIRRAQPGRL